MQLPSRGRLRDLYLLAGGAAGAISYAFGQSKNLRVFADAANDLLHGRDLYLGASVDYFKYSPTFALLFAPIAWLPAWLGATLWGAINFGAAFLGIDRVVEDDRDKRLALSTALAGILLVTDGDQSNLLVIGTMLLSFAAFERGRPWHAAAWTALGAHVKLFPALGALFALLHARPLRSLGALVVAALVLFLLPLLVLTPAGLAHEYASWRRLVQWDHANQGWSVMHLAERIGRMPVSNALLQTIGAFVLALPALLARRLGADARWRRGLLASMLVFVVLFNHRSEYASYVLSAVGLALWVTSAPSRSPGRHAIVALALLAPGPWLAFPDPSVTGIFAFLGAHRMFHPARVLPLLVAWLWMQKDLLQGLSLASGERTDP